MTVPNFVGTKLADATVAAEALGIELVPTGEPSDQEVGHDPRPGPPRRDVGAGRQPGQRHGRERASTRRRYPRSSTCRSRRRSRPSSRPASWSGRRATPSTTTSPRARIVSQNPRAGTVVAKGRPSTTSSRGAPSRHRVPRRRRHRPHADTDTHADPDTHAHADTDPDPHRRRRRRRGTPAPPGQELSVRRPGRPRGSSEARRAAAGPRHRCRSTRAVDPRRTRQAREQAFHRRSRQRGPRLMAGISGSDRRRHGRAASQQARISSPLSGSR